VRPARLPSSLHCSTCGCRFTLPSVDESLTYVCARCDVPIATPSTGTSGSGSSRGGIRYVYARPGRTGQHSWRRPFGRYTLHDEIGRGGMGVVYRAWDGMLQKFVALKVLLSGEHSTSEQVERFLREARAASKLDHANLVKVYDLGWTDDRAYFTMELVDGPTLQEVLEARGALPLNETLRIGAAISRALAAAHDQGLVHRDVKPANVLLQVDGTPLLADFGLAADLSEDTGKLTRTGQVIGTPTYMAPEQVTGEHKASPRTDQYGLGAVLFECLAGEPPYTGEEAMVVLQDIVIGPPPSLRERRPTVPKNVTLVIETAMARDPRQRYPDARALADDLERCRRGQPVIANPPSLRQRLQEMVRRNGRMLAMGGGVLTVVIAGLGVATSVMGALEDRTEERREARAAQELRTLQEEVSTLRAADREPEAMRKLLDFARTPSVVGTLSESEALLLRASLLTDAGAPDASRAWAWAYVAARDSSALDRALRGLAHEMRAAWRWDSLDEVVDQLISLGPEQARDPEVRRWRAEALLAQGRTLEASELLSRIKAPGAELLEALAQSTPAPALTGRVLREDLDQDGVKELWVVSATELAQVEPERLTVTARYPFPEPVYPSQVHLVPLGSGVVVAGTGAEIRLYTMGPDRLVPQLAWEDGAALSATSLDLDQDGTDELWVGIGPYGRHLVRLTPGPNGRWHRSDPIDSVDAAWSDVTSLAPVDVDKDGDDELVVTLSAWGGYDVRVIEGSPAGFHTAARRKMGHLSHVLPAGDGTFWVAKSDRSPSRVMFSAEAPYGEAPGIYRLSVDQGELDTELFLPAPTWRGRPPVIDSLIVGDLDGDKVQDVVYSLVSEQGVSTVLVPQGDPAQALVMGGLRATVAAQMDDDPQLELLVTLGMDGPAHVLGAGSGMLPQHKPPSLATAAVDRNLPLRLQRQWTRAEDLARMGLTDAAAEELARLVQDPSGNPRVQRRAAELAEAAGDDVSAAQLYQRVAEQTGDPLLRDRAARNFLHGHRFEEAYLLWQGVQAVPGEGRPEQPALQALLAQGRTERLTFERGLPDALVVHDPGAVQLDARAQGLRLAVLSDDAELVTVPFRWSGDRLGLTVSLELRRLEWASGVRFALRSATDEIEIALGGKGGGMILERGLSCGASFTDRAVSRAWQGTPSELLPVTLSLDLARVTGDLRCSWRIGDDSGHDNLVAAQMPAGGDWELVIGPSSPGSVDGSMAAMVVRELELQGTELVLGRASPDHAYGSLLASGVIPEEVPRGMQVWRAVALAEAGRDDEAGRALQGSPRTPETEREVAQALRSHLATFGPVVQATWPDRYHELFERAYSTALAAHPDDEVLMRALITGLPMALDARATQRIGRDRAARLLAARGRAWAGLGQPAAARRDLTDATRLGGLDTEPRGPVSSAWIGLAALAAAEGDADKALDAITRALAVSAAPELTADVVRVTPELAPYVASWSAVLP
jgi:tetratricopeptide (TPR) repeat protein